MPLFQVTDEARRAGVQADGAAAISATCLSGEEDAAAPADRDKRRNSATAFIDAAAMIHVT